MKMKEAQSQWLQRAYDVAYETSQDPEFALAFATKMFTQTRLNPTHHSDAGIGIARLQELDDVDPLNPEAALRFAAQRDADIYAQTGDITASLVGELAQTNPQAVEGELNAISENRAVVEQALASGKSDAVTGESTFTELDSPENRFRESVRNDDLEGTNNVINDLIDQRVSHRASTN